MFIFNFDSIKTKFLLAQAGVRDGITAGTLSTLQDGFNCGFKEAFVRSYEIGKVRGVLR